MPQLQNRLGFLPAVWTRNPSLPNPRRTKVAASFLEGGWNNIVQVLLRVWGLRPAAGVLFSGITTYLGPQSEGIFHLVKKTGQSYSKRMILYAFLFLLSLLKMTFKLKNLLWTYIKFPRCFILVNNIIIMQESFWLHELSRVNFKIWTI